MFVSQQIVHGFHRIESCDRDFDENGDPFCHGAIPQTGKFEGFEIFAIFRLVGNKPGVWIHEFGEVERFPFIITDRAYDIHRIKVCGLIYYPFLGADVKIDLRGFDNLQRIAITGFNPKRSSPWFPFVFHHAANANGPVEQDCQFVLLINFGEIPKIYWEFNKQFIFDVRSNLFNIDFSLTRELFQNFVDMVFILYEQRADDFFIDNRGLIFTLGNDIVDIFDKNEISIELVDIPD